MGSQKLRINQIACQHEKRKRPDARDVTRCENPCMQAKRTSISWDPQIVADAKIALREAQRAAIQDGPKNISELYAVALTTQLEEPRKKTVKVRSKRVRESVALPNGPQEPRRAGRRSLRYGRRLPGTTLASFWGSPLDPRSLRRLEAASNRLARINVDLCS
jgi:hypothetical protein